jgi:ribosomal protein L12E/L44/L45/RPP1/RPP2
MTPDLDAILGLDTGEELTAEQLAALARLDDGPLGDDADDDPYGAGFGPDSRPPDGWDLMTPAEQQSVLDAPPTNAVPEVFGAGITHRDGGPGLGFAAGGTLDRMAPGRMLTACTERAWEEGLGRLSDDELVGVMAAARRGASRQAALELAAIEELAARRAGADGCPGEHVQEEVAAALTLTGRAAASQVGLAAELTRLPGVAGALAAGRIDVDKAEVFTGQLMLLEVIAANAIAGLVLPKAPGMTTGRVRKALADQIMDYDPAALVRRRKEAEKDARVETWTEPAGTGAVAGRDLPPADVLAADQALTADARWLKTHGVDGSMDQLRAKAFTARLTGQSLDSLLPAPGAAADADAAAEGAPGAPAPGASNAPAPGVPAASAPGWPTGLAGSVNLTMPAAAWLGRCDRPGQISGLGAADAGTCRDVAGALARHPSARWCITLIGTDGHPVAHGCARAGPGPPGSDRRAWLAAVTITPVETGTCEHRRESAGYQPPDSLRHIIKIRSPRCGAPGCRRPAVACDDDHTIPYHQGGRTCECNLYPLCRRHHQTKQARGWQLRQPEPGTLIWTTPSGRTYTTKPEPYPV